MQVTIHVKVECRLLKIFENEEFVFIVEQIGNRTTRKELKENFRFLNSHGGKCIFLVNSLGDYKQLLYVGCHFAGMWCREKEDLVRSFMSAYDEKENKDFFLEFNVWEDILEMTKEKIDKALENGKGN
jgi:hypothetical protein